MVRNEYVPFVEYKGLVIEQSVEDAFEYRVQEIGFAFNITQLENCCVTKSSSMGLHKDVLREAIEHNYFTTNSHFIHPRS